MAVFSYYMMRYSLILLTFILPAFSFAGKISGTVTNEKGELLPYASISVKGRKQSTSANSQGVFFLELEPGTYTIICRHVGYERQEKTITITKEDANLDFSLKEQQVSLKEVVVNAGAEDPAYAIIRRAIKKRKEYLNENEVYECEVYSKGVMSLRDYPTKLFGQKVDFEDGDTSKKKMIYLSETVSKLSVDKPSKIKIDVLSTRVSGQRDGFGFAGASFLSFYENMVQLSKAVNPRGFVSPIAENALSFYKYKYEGAFSEEGKLINKIKVTPKRKYEPCLSGYINIVEDEWRIHSLQLLITKENQMNFGDTLRIEQLYQMMGANQWVMQSQVLYPSIRFFGFDAYGSFANVYRNFNLNPGFGKKYFNNIILKYEKGSNKKPVTYWDSIRPLQLTAEEMRDYVKKDSLEQRRQDPRYLDSIDHISNKLKPGNILYTGKTFNRQSKKMSYTIPSLLQVVNFNTVEGWVMDMPVSIKKQYTDRKSIVITPTVRYGFTGKQFYSWLTMRYNYGKKYFSNITVSGGKRIFQLNNENPIEPLQNTIGSLFYKNNFLKLYGASYGRINFSKGIGAGIDITAGIQYQNRKPLENTTDFSFIRKDSLKVYRPNYPVEITNSNFQAHQAAIFTIGISFQPKARYIEFPDRVINIGSRWPNFNLQYVKGVKGLFGSDVDYDKWQLTITDVLNLKLPGTFNYRVLAGGFLNSKNVQLPDLKHFPGNRYISAEDYLTTYQLPQYYQFSNSEKRYIAMFVEHHFNGFITNKIPGFKKLNWNLVGGANALWLPRQTYVEWHAGLENILKILRVDAVTGYRSGQQPFVEMRIGTRLNISTNDD